MGPVERHPGDEELFDLIEGRLDRARELELETHLDSCSVCATLVRSALAGSPDDVSPVETMPAAAATQLHVRMRDAWRERVEHIAATEAAEDPPPVIDAPHPFDAPARQREPRRAFSRRLVPVLAFVVLGALAGTSVLLDEPTGRAGGGDSATSESRDQDVPAAGESGGTVGTAAPITGEVAAPEDRAAAEAGETASADTTGGAVADAASGAATDAVAPPVDPATGTPTATSKSGAVVEPADPTEAPAGYDELVGQDTTLCIIAFDDTILPNLPGGRVARLVEPGPFGLYLVCG